MSFKQRIAGGTEAQTLLGFPFPSISENRCARRKRIPFRGVLSRRKTKLLVGARYKIAVKSREVSRKEKSMAHSRDAAVSHLSSSIVHRYGVHIGSDLLRNLRLIVIIDSLAVRTNFVSRAALFAKSDEDGTVFPRSISEIVFRCLSRCGYISRCGSRSHHPAHSSLATAGENIAADGSGDAWLRARGGLMFISWAVTSYQSNGAGCDFSQGISVCLIEILYPIRRVRASSSGHRRAASRFRRAPLRAILTPVTLSFLRSFKSGLSLTRRFIPSRSSPRGSISDFIFLFVLAAPPMPRKRYIIVFRLQYCIPSIMLFIAN